MPKPYQITANTAKVLSLALHELVLMDLRGAECLRELAKLIRKHAEEQSLQDLSEDSLNEAPILNHAEAPERMNAYVVFVLGGPGSGKGTICPRLVEDLGFMHLSVGELLRKEVASGSDVGKEVESIMKSGQLVPDDLAIRIARDAIGALGSAEGLPVKVLLDGFPRTVEQAMAFEDTVCPAAKVLWFTCDEQVLVNRILERGKTSGREDDTAESVMVRLKTFNECTDRIRQYYESQPVSKITLIDASRSVDEVYEQVRSVIA